MRFDVPASAGPLVTLARGDMALAVAPACGARIASFTMRGLDILRPASASGLRSGRCYEFAGFPLLPYSGPVFGGGFRFNGEFFPLGRTVPEEPTATHGEAWIRPWQTVVQDADRLVLRMDHHPADGEFPFAFRGEITFALHDDGLSIGIILSCRDHRPMPVGIGFHPYFPKSPGTMMHFDATGLWPPDSEESVGLSCGPLLPGLDFTQPRDVSAMVLDRCYEGWGGKAELAYADGRRVAIAADGALRKLQIYDAWDYPYICIEPVSNANDGFNRLALGAPCHGVHVLEPAQSLRGTVLIKPAGCYSDG
ncbi:MAG: aldose 1-epimerase [Parvibaculaceae bacterium]